MQLIQIHKLFKEIKIFRPIGHFQGHHVTQQECPSVSIGHILGHHVTVRIPSVSIGHLQGHNVIEECPSKSTGHLQGHYEIQGCNSLCIISFKYTA
jgi:hypothetical protein